jgi:putative heme-binding domain-containing protein
LGIYRPLPTRIRTELAAAIEAPLRALFDSSTGDLAAASIRAMKHFGLRLDDRSVVSRARDGRQPLDVRRVAVEQLFADRRFDERVLMQSLVVDDSPALRSLATRAYVSAFPDEAATTLRGLIAMEHDQDYRTAYDLLTQATAPDQVAILLDQLDLWKKGQLYRTVHLDLYEAASQNPTPAVRAKLSEVMDQRSQQGQTLDELTLEGGDPARGRLVFQNQGVCLKCHLTDEGGGTAGPTLANIGRLRRADELLQSILDPNASVEPRFGTVTAILDDGSTIAGVPIESSEQQLMLRTPTGDIRSIQRDRIEELSPITSPMPKQVENLSRRELRDLIAYLETLRGRP